MDSLRRASAAGLSSLLTEKRDMMKKAMGFLFLLMLLSLGALAQADEILVGSEGAQTLTEAVA